MMKDSPKVGYTKHLLSSSSSFKNKELLAKHGGGKIKGNYVSFMLTYYGSSPWVSFEHGTFSCLCLTIESPIAHEASHLYESFYYVN